MTPALQHCLAKHQAPDGAFASLVDLGGLSVADSNGFVTAQVLHALHNLDAAAPAVSRALDFLETCRDPASGACRFWPRGHLPSWAKHDVIEDADDTALQSIVLARHGRLDEDALRRVVCRVLVPRRLRAVASPMPPWIAPGVFRTWLRDDAGPDTIDCCVNANVVALLAWTGLMTLPGYAEACAMIEVGIRWAGRSRQRARALTPYYPEPVELRFAVEHALACGASRLAGSLSLLRDLPWAATPLVADAPVFGSAYGGYRWRAPILHAVRAASEPCEARNPLACSGRLAAALV